MTAPKAIRLIQIDNYFDLLRQAGYTRIWESHGVRDLPECSAVIAQSVADVPPTYLTDADLDDLAHYGHRGPLIEMAGSDHDRLWRDLLTADALLRMPVDEFVSPAAATNAREQMARLERGIDQLDKHVRGHDGRLHHDPRLLDTLLAIAAAQP